MEGQEQSPSTKGLLPGAGILTGLHYKLSAGHPLRQPSPSPLIPMSCLGTPVLELGPGRGLGPAPLAESLQCNTETMLCTHP